MIVRKLFILISIFAVYFCGCNEASNPEEPVNPVATSDLTRTGKFIAFTSDKNGNEDIWIAQVNSTGLLEGSGLVFPTNPFNLTSGNSTPDRIPNWSRDGRVLVFTRESGNIQELWAFFFADNGSIDPGVTTNPRQLISSGGNWDNNASFSPDGNYMIFDRRYDNDSIQGIGYGDTRDLYIGNISGTGNNFSVTNIRPVLTSPRYDESNPKWSPRINVRRVMYDFTTPYFPLDRDIYVIDPLDSANNLIYYTAGRSGHAAWQPGCTRILYETDYENGGVFKIMVHRYPTESYMPENRVQSPVQDNRYPSWQPNGEYFIYSKFIAPSKGKLYTQIATGGTEQFLLPSEFDSYNNTYPAW